MISINSEKHNSLLGRKEFSLEISFPARIPSKAELQKELAEKQKVTENLVVIKYVQGVYGDRKAKAVAYIYDNEKALKNIEPKKKEKKEPKAKPVKGAKKE